MNEIKLLEIGLNLDLYEDEFDQEGVWEFENTLTKEEFSIFREYVIEVRDGKTYFECEIQSDPKVVRFGFVNHSVENDGVKVRGALVLKSLDESNPEKENRYNGDYKDNVETDLIKTKIKYEKLLALLIRKNMLTPEELQEINNVSSKEMASQNFDYHTF
ncbi:hypothetical protein [Priestia flexa]|uniref:hypothetical protein n=1 Tax=Priestia flexa TaxID=86664 RepID=UPI0024911E7A|nr:hypothetical protein [Priestia flexa]